MTIDSGIICQEIVSHIEGSWPDREQDDFTWELGPIKDRLPNFRVRRVSPIIPAQGYIYFSVGAFEAGDSKWEFFIKAPAESARHVETLAMISHYHSFPEHNLHPGSIVDIGRPWAEGSSFRHLMVSWPHSLDVRAAACMTSAGEVTFLWLVAISENEAEFAYRQGVERLEDKLESSGVNVIDPFRESVV